MTGKNKQVRHVNTTNPDPKPDVLTSRRTRSPEVDSQSVVNFAIDSAAINLNFLLSETESPTVNLQEEPDFRTGPEPGRTGPERTGPVLC